MLEQYVHTNNPSFLTTYTRNPSVLKMMRTVAKDIYPDSYDDELSALAEEMPGASRGEDGVIYHVDRYGEGGLFKDFDPADHPLSPGELPLKSRFLELQNVRSALVVAARIGMETTQ